MLFKIHKMKKLFILLAFVFSLNTKAQTWVTIPDANFVTYLQGLIPSAMHENQINHLNQLRP